MKKIALFLLLVSLFTACTKGTNERYLILKFQFTDTLPSYNDTGGIYTDFQRQIDGVEGLTPLFNKISAHQIILLRDSSLASEPGLYYEGEESFTRRGFDSMGIDYSNATFVKEGENFLTIPLSTIKPGSYEYLKVEFSYQNVNIPFKLDTLVQSFRDPITQVQYPGAYFNGVYAANIASFLGYNTFISNGYSINSYFQKMDSQYLSRGFYAFETQLGSNGINYPAWTETRRSNVAAVNMLHKYQPNIDKYTYTIAPIHTSKYNKNGDFIVTQTPLVITGAETESVIINCQLSTYKCFEWQERNGNKIWEPFKGEPIHKVGFRGMKPIVVK